MISLMSLWMPIVLSAVLVFIVSSVVHMVFTYHKDDFRKLPDEDSIMAALRAHTIPPGDYMAPYCGTAAEMKDPGYQERLRKGPVFMATFHPNGPPNMGKSLTQWFLYCLLISLFAGYLASRTVPPGSDYLAVFRIVGTVAFAAYALGYMQQSIWYAKSWGATARSMFDGLLYALVTAGVFGWRWPAM